MNRPFLVFWLLIALIAAVLGTSAYLQFSKTDEDFSLYNPQWNGMADLKKDGAPVHDLRDLDGFSEDAVLFVIGPQLEYTSEEAIIIERFLMDGGTVVVADDFGSGNSLLEGLDVPVRFSNQPVLQEVEFWMKQSFPIIENTNNSTVLGKLVLNHPSDLIILSKGSTTIHAQTSNFAWRDVISNEIKDSDEPFDRYAIIAEMSHKGGKLYVISDPDLLINSMIMKGDNQMFYHDLTAGKKVLFDESHRRVLPKTVSIHLFIKEHMAVQGAMVGMIILSIWGTVWMRRRPDVEVQEVFVNRAALTSNVINHHPDFKLKDINRIKGRLK